MAALAGIFNEPMPLLLIVLAILLFFGAQNIPKLAKALGRAKGEFNVARKEMDAETQRVESGATAGANEEQIRRTARELGIAEEGKSLAEVKKALAEKLA